MSEDLDPELEIDAQETRRLIGPNSYNDNWELVSYTSELRDSKGNFFAFVDFHGDEGKVRECPWCLKYGFHNKLGPRILKKGQKPAPDHDQWTSCQECGNIFPIYESHYESEIRDNLETVNDPFESNASHFECTKKRKYKDRRLKQYLDDDPDIAREQKRYDSDNVRIIR